MKQIIELPFQICGCQLYFEVNAEEITSFLEAEMVKSQIESILRQWFKDKVMVIK